MPNANDSLNSFRHSSEQPRCKSPQNKRLNEECEKIVNRELKSQADRIIERLEKRKVDVLIKNKSWNEEGRREGNYDLGYDDSNFDAIEIIREETSKS